MKISSPASDLILKRIAREFSKYRDQHGGKRVRSSSELKLLAMSALEAGLSIHDVAMAAGVSGWTISNWKKTHGTPVPKVACRELKLIEGTRGSAEGSILTYSPYRWRRKTARVDFSGASDTLLGCFN